MSAERLVGEAADLADEQGFAAVTPSTLARRVGLTVPSLYAHVRSAHDLRTRVALLALQELADRLSEALAGRSGAAALTALGDTHRDYARTHPGRWQALTLRLDPDQASASAGPRLARLLGDALLGYGLQGQDATHALRLVASTVRGFVDLEVAGGFAHSPPQPDETWTRILGALNVVLASWPGTDDGRPAS